MAETETYVTKEKPTVEDWLQYNSALFAKLKGSPSDSGIQYSPLTDVDEYASEAGMSTEEYYEQIKNTVGSLGNAALRLVHSEMDDSWHVTVEF